MFQRLPILKSVDQCPLSVTNLSQGLCINALSWLSLKANIHKIITKNLDFGNLTPNELNELIKNIQSQIKDVASKKRPINQNPESSHQRKKKKNAIWWTRELEIKRSKTRALRRLFQKERDQNSRTIKKQAYKKNLADTLFSSITEPTATQDFIQLTCEKVEGILSKIKPNKAEGTDGLPGEIIKEIFFANRYWFTSLLNHLLKNGIFPPCWKIARIVLIDKENKELNHPSHFRPICILPCRGKILDKVISGRLSFHLESEGILRSNQYGFRKNKSTILAIKNILDFHKDTLEEKHLTRIISIDLSNAFNSVDWNILLSKVFSLHIPDYLKNIITSFLKDRTAQLNGHHKDYNRGIPQGSSLGPILWNIFINDLLLIDFGPNTKVQAFADDILLMIKPPAAYYISKECRIALNMLNDWTERNFMTINNSKSIFTILSNKSISRIPTIKIGNARINYAKQIKYLGIYIDSKLNWNFHLNQTQDKINNLFHKLYRISRATWGLNPKVKKEIYIKVIERIIAYGHEVWFQNKVKQNVKLLQLQRIGLTNITRCYRTVSTEALQVLAGLPPLDIKINLLQRMFQCKYYNKDLSLRNFTLQSNSFQFLKSIVHPWTKLSIPWTWSNSLISSQIFPPTSFMQLWPPTGGSTPHYIRLPAVEQHTKKLLSKEPLRNQVGAAHT
ncbi:putative 115 kDa protein in type-1 retrotransposable element R1DM [Caerostris darwini]|uniref:115 kDa protein in type-1 retrotransposable element R1DM n=1 Tax=Caerostris darwini TaxID=1538125 RepID=A0AAV4WH75_9ARAC|nr:putative 115 kDa protein in type-1 retrotransposable element R1DM [Caerostris darwini]